jgi:transglutaminase-like putative cysteine protease
MRKFIALLALLPVVAFAHAEESWLGLYRQGNKIGYAYSSLTDTILNKVPAKKSESNSVMNVGMLGQAMSIKMASTSWIDKQGRPIMMKFDVESGGRHQKIDALFTTKDIDLNIDNSGAKSTKVIPLPKDASVVDDAVNALMEHGYKTGSQAFYYVLDPMTASLVKNRITVQGKTQITIHGKSVQAEKIEMVDPGTTMYAYISDKGDLLRVDGPMGIEMLPVTKKEALSEANAGTVAENDIASATSIVPDKAIQDVGEVSDLKLRVTGHELSSLPSDAHQTVSKSEGSWIIDVHPVAFGPSSTTIANAAQEKPEWTKPSFNIPSSDQVFRDLAKKLVNGATTVSVASKRVQEYVNNTMVPNAGIGVLRDAGEVLKTKEGVCRDYAVLTATLLRAAHVPARLVSGLVYEQGSFYYHAWVEVWDGSHWIGVDSTLPNGKVTAGHIKLGEGSVEQAFTFTFLDKVKVEVLDVRRA